MHRFVGILGMLTMMGLAFAFSTNRRAIRYKTVAWGLGLQIAFAFLVMRWDYGRLHLCKTGRRRELAARFRVLRIVIRIRRSGTEEFAPRLLLRLPGAPTIIFIAAFFAVLYYLGVMQVIVKAAARVMTSLMGASGAESLNVAASIFMGQTEAPLTIRPFLPEVTRSELMTIMTSGMAHVSGGMMAAYIAYGIEAKHLLAAVIMTAPGNDPDRENARAGNGKAADRGPRGDGRRWNATSMSSAPFRAAQSMACISRSTWPRC